MKDFGTALNCMDGRVQRKAADYLSNAFGVRHVDTVTAPGMIKHVAETTDRTRTIMSDVSISLDKHGSTQIGVVAHAECAGNPVSDSEQKSQVAQAVARLERDHPDLEVIGLWVNASWIVERIRPN